MSNPNPAVKQPPKAHQFQLGNPGRPKGSRNQLTESFLSALHRDFQANGIAAIEGARAESPLGYCKMIASLLPSKVEVEKTGDMSDAELVEIVRNGGLGGVTSADLPEPNVVATGNA